MNFSQNYVLYYPTIQFEDYEWLWAAALLWDRIYRIVPDGVKLHECRNIQELISDGEIGIHLSPKKYTKNTAKLFIENLKTQKWSAAALDTKRKYNSNTARLHREKIDYQVRNMLINQGFGKSDSEWFEDLPEDFVALYMIYLANVMAIENKMSVVTDNSIAWAGYTYFNIHKEPFDDECSPYHNHVIMDLLIRDFIPANILDFSPQQILDFRRTRKDERQNFMDIMNSAAKKLSEYELTEVYDDRLNDIKNEIQNGLTEYKKSMDMLKIVKWTGASNLFFSASVEVANRISNMNSTTISLLNLGIMTTGAYSLYKQHKYDQAQNAKSNGFSYLYDIQKKSNQNGDYRNVLRNSLYEFIND